jgi:hypothetical protein
VDPATSTGIPRVAEWPLRRVLAGREAGSGGCASVRGCWFRSARGILPLYPGRSVLNFFDRRAGNVGVQVSERANTRRGAEAC